jgi:hypothetical protein
MLLNGGSDLNREDLEDRKEKILAHLAAEPLDSVMDSEEVAHHKGWNSAHDLAFTISTKTSIIFSLRSSRFNFVGY